MITFNGTPVAHDDGQTIAAALINAGIRSWRTTRHNNSPRGVFCGIGVCFDCLITVNGQPSQRACLVVAQEGDEVTGE